MQMIENEMTSSTMTHTVPVRVSPLLKLSVNSQSFILTIGSHVDMAYHAAFSAQSSWKHDTASAAVFGPE